jgi:hypothetical protein
MCVCVYTPACMLGTRMYTVYGDLRGGLGLEIGEVVAQCLVGERLSGSPMCVP